MKKNLLNKINKVLTKHNIELTYDIYKQKLFINGIPYTDKSLKRELFYIDIKSSIKEIDDKVVIPYIVEVAKQKAFNSNDIKLAEKKEKESIRQQEKEQKEAIKEQKLIEREQKLIDKENSKKEIETALESFIDTFDYTILDNFPKTTHKGTIEAMLTNKNLPIKSYVTKRILTQYSIQNAIKQKESYEKIGYILNDENKPDSNLPVNYEVFFENYFLNKEQWDEIEDKSTIKDHGYCYFDKWGNKMFVYDNGSFASITPELMRTIVRQYSPLNNVYVVNDMWENWVKKNREDNSLRQYIQSLKWDGIDRLGINTNNNEINSNDNIFCTVLGVNQTNLNKKMFNYSLLHACRQIFWPGRYNFQHILSLLGDTNTGKTKTLQDIFTFTCGIYYCEGVDVNGPAWTWGARLMEVVANIWNEKKGINAANNETIKNFIDIINGRITYQPKNKNEFVNEPSHNICFITFNPKQGYLLTDYSVSYEKRYWIIECNMNEQTFKDKYLNTINENKEQIWAQLYQWVITNQESINELNEEETNELKEIQKRNKGITSNDVEERLHYWLNVKTYVPQRIVDIDQIKQSDKMKEDYNMHKDLIQVISVNAFKDLLKFIGFDSRHTSFVDKNMINRLGFEQKNADINGKTYWSYVRINNGQRSFDLGF